MMQSIAIAVFQEASEAFTVGLMEVAKFCAIHGKRVGIYSKDMTLARHLREDLALHYCDQNHHKMASNEVNNEWQMS